MRNKLRFFAVIIVICFLFYMRNDPQDAKMQANQISQDIASSLRENLTEENVTSMATKVVETGIKFSNAASKFVERIFSEFGYESSENALNTGGTEYLTRVLLNNGYEKCGGSGGAEYFYKIAEDRHVLGVVVCDSNQTDVISDAGIHRMRSCYKRSLHNMNDSDILVIVFGDKKSTAFTEDNIMIVDEFCRRIEKVRVDQKFSPVVALARKSVAYAKNEDKQLLCNTMRSGFHKKYHCYLVYILIAMNLFAFMHYFTQSSIYGVSAKTVIHGEDYRLVTYMFLHSNMSHLVSNMIALFIIGNALTKRVGNIAFGIIYLAGGIFGGYVSCYASFCGAKDMSTITVGASGAIFALLGALLVDMFMDSKNIAKGIMSGATALILSGFAPHVDTFCHIGGFLSGMMIMFIINVLNEIHFNLAEIRTIKKQQHVLGIKN